MKIRRFRSGRMEVVGPLQQAAHQRVLAHTKAINRRKSGRKSRTMGVNRSVLGPLVKQGGQIVKDVG